MIFITLLITLVYTILIVFFIIGFNRLKTLSENNVAPINSFTIVIPFRNEEEVLSNLADSLKKLDYPIANFEILFINDASQDGSVAEIENSFLNSKIDMKILDNELKSNSPKKDAIQTAVQHAKFDWIVTTDADCVVPQQWLQLFNTTIEEHQASFIAGPITYGSVSNFLEQFQLLDVLSLQGVTMGAFGNNTPFLCNGANLCYSKKMFYAVNGFDGNLHIASGDDIFLLEKIKASLKGKVIYLKSKGAIVKSQPEPTFKKLLQQRVRWAAKSTHYKNSLSKVVALSVLSMNTLLIVLIILCITGGFSWLYLMIIFLCKLLVDGILLAKTTAFFEQNKLLSAYPISSLFYPFFTMFVALASLTLGYQWKGRQFKK